MSESQDSEAPLGEGGTANSSEPELEPRAEQLISALAERFPNEGVSLADWRRVTAKAIGSTQRDRFLRIKSDTAIANVTAVVEHFGPYGLTTRQYLQAVAKHLLLLSLKPDTLIGNIESVARHFAGDGLTTCEYLRAALKQSALFYQRPETVIANVENVALHFAHSGLSTRAYLSAALKQPTLFAQKPQTIIGHINLLASMHERLLLPIPPGRKALMDFIVRRPEVISLADDNLHLRELAAHIADTREGKAPIQPTRPNVEEIVKHALRHEDNGKVSHARRLLLNALKHEGYIKDR